MPRNNGNNTTTLSPSSSVGLVIESSFFIILSLIILAGNTLVCTAIYKNRKLRTKTNYYIVSLAVADIMVGVFSVPYWVYFRLGESNLWLKIIIKSGTKIVKVSKNKNEPLKQSNEESGIIARNVPFQE